jgi:DnaK suppressor protein
MTQSFDDAAARRRLQSDQERVQGLIEGLRDEGLDQEEANQVGDLSHLPQHQADQGSEVFEREKDMAILEQLERELAEIEAALQRLDEGTYGVDEVTGEPIAAERLEAYPIARTNVDDHPSSAPDVASS